MMKTIHSTLALLITAAFAAGAAHGQNTTPMAGDAASAPLSRADVKRERDAAAKQGSIPKGDAGATTARPTGGPMVKRSPEAGESRQAVKAEARRALKAGEIPEGDAGVSKEHPKGGAVGVSTTSTASRAEVKAEARAAIKANEIPRGDAGATATAPKGAQPIPK